MGAPEPHGSRCLHLDQALELGKRRHKGSNRVCTPVNHAFANDDCGFFRRLGEAMKVLPPFHSAFRELFRAIERCNSGSIVHLDCWSLRAFASRYWTTRSGISRSKQRLDARLRARARQTCLLNKCVGKGHPDRKVDPTRFWLVW